MAERVENKHVVGLTPLVAPREVKARYPLPESARLLVLRTRHAIRDIIHGRDLRRLVVIAGPCSIHDPDAACEYAENLKRVAAATRGKLVIVMRTYFEKPRTTVGWKGLINDPRMDGSCDIARGLELARELLVRINTLGVPCASEMLDPITPQYLADLISWAAIGARTTESQTHREMASGLSMPVGFKNSTDGSLQGALNAMISARQPHSFLGINTDGMTCIVKTAGNPDRHVVLRGGGGKTNFSPGQVAQAAQLVAGEKIVRPIMVDCSHDNAEKNHTRQSPVCQEVLKQVRQGQQALMGVMLESNLKSGKQTWKEGSTLVRGMSLTDPCIGWEETEELLLAAAAATER